MRSIDLFRRRAIVAGIAMPVLLCTSRLAIAEESQTILPTQPGTAAATPIEVDVTGVTNVPSLIRAIRKSAEGLLPATIRDSEIRAEIARVFVKHAHAAAEKGYKVPQWVLDRMPQRKVVLPFLGIAIFTVAGITFAVPVSTIVIVVLASMVLMTGSVSAAINSMVGPKKKKTA